MVHAGVGTRGTHRHQVKATPQSLAGLPAKEDEKMTVGGSVSWPRGREGGMIVLWCQCPWSSRWVLVMWTAASKQGLLCPSRPHSCSRRGIFASFQCSWGRRAQNELNIYNFNIFYNCWVCFRVLDDWADLSGIKFLSKNFNFAKISLQTSLERNSSNFLYISFLGVNFESLTVKFHIPYILNIHIKFRLNWILFTIWSINLFFIYLFRSPKLEIITFIWLHSNWFLIFLKFCKH